MAQIPLPKAGTLAASLNVPQALAQALQFHERGQLAEAEKLYAAILVARPDHFDALQMMGMVKLAKGQAADESEVGRRRANYETNLRALCRASRRRSAGAPHAQGTDRRQQAPALS